jgi:hypothetical protein
MLLSLGMPALAAASHGHEFSTPTEHETNMDQQHGFLHSLQYLHNHLSALTPFSYGNPRDATRAEPGNASAKSGEVERLREQNCDRAQEHSEDRESIQEDASITESRRKQPRKTTTSFQLAHPPPTPKHKPRWKRSRVVLQLRQISGTRSPVPALEVLPPTCFTHRLMRPSPRGHSRKSNLNADDLVVVKSQVYGHADKESRVDEDSDEDNGASREVVAVISPPGKGDSEAKEHAQILLEGGATWTALATDKGGYEFTTCDEHGLTTTARWWPSKRRRGNSNPHRLPGANEDGDKVYKFSILNPRARRHPVIGSMNRYTIDVQDDHTSPSGTPSVTPTFNTMTSQSILSPQQSYFGGNASRSDPINDVDERLKTLLLVTGIWVAFVEGWAKSNTDTGTSTSTVNSNSPWTNRPTSGRFELGKGLHSGAPQSTTSSRSRHQTFNVLHRSTASTSSTPTAHRSPAAPQRAFSLGASAAGRGIGHSVSFANRRMAAVSQDNIDVDQGQITAAPVCRSRGDMDLELSPPVIGPTSLEEPQTSPGDSEFTGGEEVEDDDAFGTPRFSIDDTHAPGVISPPVDSSSVLSKPNPKKKGKLGRLLKSLSKRRKRDH